MPFKKGQIPEGAKPFKPGESGNPRGRPRKLVSSVISDLEGRGVEHITKQQVVGMIEVLYNLTESELKEITYDKEQSVLMRTVATMMARSIGKGGERIFDMIVSRGFGRPEQKTDLTTNGKDISIAPIEWVNSEVNKDK